MSNYDSTADTLKHIRRVGELLAHAASELLARAIDHDKTKLQSPEKELFDIYTPKLKSTEYGSDEYKKDIKELGVALDHHYSKNSHHPEHHDNGIDDFDLFDLVEMFFDWMAATERTQDGDINKSLIVNRDRFGISDQLFKILCNTVERYNMESVI